MSDELSKFFAAIAEEKKKSKAETQKRSKKSARIQKDFVEEFSKEFKKLREQEEQHKRDVAAMEAWLTSPVIEKNEEPVATTEQVTEEEIETVEQVLEEDKEILEALAETPLQEQALEYLNTKKKEITEESAEVESIKKQIQDLKRQITNLNLAQQGMGGGGAVNIKDMDDVDRSTALVNGKFLKYNSATGKFIGADAVGGDVDAAAILDNSGTPELAVGITAEEVRTLIGAGTSTFDGAYGSLSGTPTIPSPPAIEDNSGTPALATGITAAEVRTAIGAGTSTFDGAYSSLSGKPTIPAAPALEDNSGTPALATGITAAEVRTAIGAIDDYTVTESDVTAHQAALSITESQISDLQSYLTAVSEAAVTAHQAALSITESQISDLQTYALASSVSNVTNESKATMFTSAALTGTPTAPTAATGTDTTQIATTAFVKQEIDALKALLYAYDQS
mgnify:CR=1 FL=1|tara:strand:+ start:701 stop:2056 length:1356 start_codon:yes stop_codon:yes gene_type:complete